MYRWTREDHRRTGNGWYLAPVGQCYHGQIANVTVRTERYPKRRLICSARYRWNSTGNKPEGWAEFNSVARAKKWCEAQLAAFWEPPAIGVEQ